MTINAERGFPKMVPSLHIPDDRRRMAALFAFCMAVGFLTYGYALVTAPLSIDQEIATFNPITSP